MMEKAEQINDLREVKHFGYIFLQGKSIQNCGGLGNRIVKPQQ